MRDAHVFVEDVLEKGVGFFFDRVFEMRLIVQSEIAGVGRHFADFVQGQPPLCEVLYKCPRFFVF